MLSNHQPGQTLTFGTLLRRLREAARLTQEQLAERAGLSAKAVSALERGERQRPYQHTVEALATALRLDEATYTALLAAVPSRGDAQLPIVPSTAPSLPTPLTALIGRDEDLATVRRWLTTERVRLVTLVGPGGVGKTRLAQEIATNLAPQFVDGVAFVELASIKDHHLVMSAVATTLDVREVAGLSIRDVLSGFLRTKHMLLVLDNFEHLVMASVEVAVLLRECCHITILCTSRAPLHIRGEREYPVAPLDIPAFSGVPSLADVVESPAVQLFTERAQSVVPSFAVSQQNAVTVVEICRRLDGLPLALELAAARLKLLPLTALLARLDRVLPLLIGGAHDLPERQHTLRQTVAWSYALLNTEEQQVFRRLAVFAGGWTLDAATAVCDTGEVEAMLEHLQSLLNKSLIRRGCGEEPRWYQLETIRAFGLEELERNNEVDAVRRRYADSFAEYIQTAGPTLLPAEMGHGDWLDRVEQNYDNLRSVLALWMANGSAERVILMGWALYGFWLMRGHIAEGRGWLEAALANATILSPTMEARARAIIGVFAFEQHDYDQAAFHLDRGLALASSTDAEAYAFALQTQGYVALGRGNSLLAAAYFAQALAKWRELGNHWGTGIALTGAGYASLHLADTEDALLQLEAGETELRAANAGWYLVLNLNMQAAARLPRGEYAIADQLLRESVRISQQYRDTWALTQALEGLAMIAVFTRRSTDAARLFGKAEALREKLGNMTGNVGWQTIRQEHIARLEGILDRALLHEAWTEGRTMQPDQAIALALAAPPI